MGTHKKANVEQYCNVEQYSKKNFSNLEQYSNKFVNHFKYFTVFKLNNFPSTLLALSNLKPCNTSQFLLQLAIEFFSLLQVFYRYTITQFDIH